MIVCPNCKEEIDDNSRFCDQCGQQLLFCTRCGRVGLGRRCIHCGGEMGELSEGEAMATTVHSMPLLILQNGALGLSLVGENQAVIGRKQGPYSQQLAQQGYISGTHAQLRYHADKGWCIVDLGSSNGTRVSGRLLAPDVEETLRSGDIVALANVELQVNIK
mgnify:CR=1 FL=1